MSWGKISKRVQDEIDGLRSALASVTRERDEYKDEVAHRRDKCKENAELLAQVAALVDLVAEAGRLLSGPIMHGDGVLPCGGKGGCFICDFVVASKTSPDVECAKARMVVIEAADESC